MKALSSRIGHKAQPMTATARLTVPFIVIFLIAGLWGGLSRWVFELPVLPALRTYHGPLLGALVFPALIGIERAVAIGGYWAWSAPLVAISGIVGLLFFSKVIAPLVLLAALGLLLQQLVLWHRSPGVDGETSIASGVALIIADVAWLFGLGYTTSALGWACFLVLLICAERLELSFLGRSRAATARTAYVVMLGGLLGNSARVVGLSWLILALWLLRHDFARRNALRSGLHAYCARAILVGYAWLAFAGLNLCISGSTSDNFDSVFHSIFVGFVLSMVMAHGPIIFPALLRCSMSFTRLFYLPLTLLHLSLILRFAGWRQEGGAGNLVSFLLFILTIAYHGLGSSKPWRKANPSGREQTVPE